jgi:hypothetical protein
LFIAEPAAAASPGDGFVVRRVISVSGSFVGV